MPALGATTRLCCVLGDPVAHSRSPRMHNAAYAALGLDRRYVAFRVAPDRLAAAVAGLGALGVDGANVTVPHKVAAAALCDTVSDAAHAAGAVNTIVFDGDGRPHGHLTDGTGLVAAVLAAAPSALAGPVTLIGAGGSARAAGAALLAAGAPRLVVVARRADAAHALRAELARLAPSAAVVAAAAPPEGALGLVVNCTPIGGLSELEALPLPADTTSRMDAVADFAYRADGTSTPLVDAARAAGRPAVDGLELLVAQGVEAFRLMTGAEPPVDVMRAAARGEQA